MAGRRTRAERGDVAVERILDAAAELFAARGVDAVAMQDVARASGCSRATLYRYFENRGALRTAFVHREARRIGREVARESARRRDPAARVVEAIVSTLRHVRTDPNLHAWFGPDNVGVTSPIAQSSEVIESIVLEFLGDSRDESTVQLARWIVRVVVSLLAVPGRDDEEERMLLRRFVAPIVLAPAS